MTALGTDRNTPRTEGGSYRRPVKGGVKIFVGALVVLDVNGFARPGYTATGLRADGVSHDQVDNTLGADGALLVPVRAGNYFFANSTGADLIAATAIGNTAYIVDDQTVALTSGSGTRSVAGTILDISPAGQVLVSIGFSHT